MQRSCLFRVLCKEKGEVFSRQSISEALVFYHIQFTARLHFSKTHSKILTNSLPKRSGAFYIPSVQ